VRRHGQARSRAADRKERRRAFPASFVMPWKDLELDGEHMRVRMLRDANRPRSTDEAEEVFFSEAPKSGDSCSHVVLTQC